MVRGFESRFVRIRRVTDANFAEPRQVAQLRRQHLAGALRHHRIVHDLLRDGVEHDVLVARIEPVSMARKRAWL